MVYLSDLFLDTAQALFGELELTNDSKEFLIRKGANLDYGARPLRRSIENFVEDPLSEELLKGEFKGNGKILVDVIKDKETCKMKRLNFEGMRIDVVEPEAVTAGACTGEGDPNKK